MKVKLAEFFKECHICKTKIDFDSSEILPNNLRTPSAGLIHCPTCETPLTIEEKDQLKKDSNLLITKSKPIPVSKKRRKSK